MLCTVVYDQDNDRDDDGYWDEADAYDRARHTAVVAIVTIASVVAGIVLGFVLNWIFAHH